MAELPKPISQTVSAVYEQYRLGYGANYDSYGIGFSEMGEECDRRIWYGHHWVYDKEPVEGLKARRFKSGDREEDRILEDLKGIGVEIRDCQKKVTLCGGHLRGKIEGIGLGFPEAPKTEHVFEIKTLKAADFRAILKHGLAKHNPKHRIQMLLGMDAVGLDRAIYIGQNQETSELLTEREKDDKVTVLQVKARAERIIDSPEPPPKLHKDPEAKAAFRCRFCPALGVCHKGKAARINCRTCLHATPVMDGHGGWHCAYHNCMLDRKQQPKGCGHHLFHPDLVPGDQIDMNEKEEWVSYRIGPDAVPWTDHAGTEKDLGVIDAAQSD